MMHVAIIMDGNRRFAKKLLLKPWKGHEAGIQKLREVLGWCNELDVKEVTLYAFSLENFRRSNEEIGFLFDIFEKEFRKWKDDARIMEEGWRINVIGRVDLFPANVQEAIKEITAKTMRNDKCIINFALAYGGRGEIVDAAKKIAGKVKDGRLSVDDIDEKAFSDNLYLSSEPDIVIRTGGEVRTSNFLLWQSAYSEWFFVSKMWPELTKDDIVKCLEEFKGRKRNFGR